MAETSPTGATALPTARSGFAICALTLLSAVFLQKIALPGTGGLYPLSLFIFPAMTAVAFIAGVFEVNTPAFVWYAIFVAMAALSTALSPSPHVSVLSLGFMVVAQFPLVLRSVSSEISYPRVMNFLSTVGCVSALIGVSQFAGQFVVGVDAAFFLDTRMPENFTVTGYNSLIPLYWSSPVFKSNGVFFLEPSFFCQFLAIALVAELLLGPRALRLLILTAGLVCSYSGTGLTMLALFLPAYFLRHGHSRLFFFAALVSIVLIMFGDELSLDAFTRRVSEFSDVQSSGWARFLSMFHVLQNVLFANDLTFFLGRGPGTVQEQFRLLSFNAFDPTWGKVIYEYGLLGALIYFRFFYVAFCRGPRGLRFAVGYTYLFLGGYLLNPSVLMQVAALVVWFGKTPAGAARSDEVAKGKTGHVAMPALGIP
ncbi:hypothetical protein [Bradyrhizobium sp. CCBAU 53421]|uniref:hypothetical protein n=1 Tax=Bradyrhizobium sp. CCBAU 53421 TaxID=1325120 RepID=UPI001889C459|nr:hypothetical protein [Bradyrhizobium sp. CCBAU 53421]QOZ32703.1 hypothetical protein XH92_14150 [Bradyrhizobium sp. CCBAU 53421]